MNEVININFQGRVIPIEVPAYNLLKTYLGAINSYFANEPGKDEIVNDIEGRIAELFDEEKVNGASAITEPMVNSIINSIGWPQDFDGEHPEVMQQPLNAAATEAAAANNQNFQSTDATANSQNSGTGANAGNTTTSNSSNTSTSSTTTNTNQPKQLFRSETDKVIAGVGGGLGAYFNVDAWLMRIIFIILAFIGGLGIILYVIMWIVVPSSATTNIGSPRKRLFRDADNGIIAGVCAGLGNYLNIDYWIVRLLFLLPAIISLFNISSFVFDNFDIKLNFWNTSFLIYIILWIVVPVAKTISDKLEMKGEPVDLETITNAVKAEQLGKTNSGSSSNNSNTSSGNKLGNIIVSIAKVLVYILFVFLIILVAILLISLLISSVVAFNYKDYILSSTGQNIAAFVVLICCIILPLVTLIIYVIRKLRKQKGAPSKWYSTAFWVLFGIGIFTAIGLGLSIAQDFSKGSMPIKSTVPLTHHQLKSLRIKATPTSIYNNENENMDFDFSFGYNNRFNPNTDSIFIDNVYLHFKKSNSDSFQVRVYKTSRGSSKSGAMYSAEKISYQIYDQDSILYMDNCFPITPYTKFRDQEVDVVVYVPVGKKIYVNKGNDLHGGGRYTYDNNDDDSDANVDDYYDNYSWNSGVWYVMTANGLRALNSENDAYDNNTETTKSEYEQNKKAERKKQAEEKKLDSLEKLKNKIDVQIDSISDNLNAQYDAFTGTHALCALRLL